MVSQCICQVTLVTPEDGSVTLKVILGALGASLVGWLWIWDLWTITRSKREGQHASVQALRIQFQSTTETLLVLQTADNPRTVAVEAAYPDPCSQWEAIRKDVHDMLAKLGDKNLWHIWRLLKASWHVWTPQKLNGILLVLEKWEPRMTKLLSTIPQPSPPPPPAPVTYMPAAHSFVGPLYGASRFGGEVKHRTNSHPAGASTSPVERETDGATMPL